MRQAQHGGSPSMTPTRGNVTHSVEARQDAPRGVLNPAVAADRFKLGRFLPSPDLAPFVEHYWRVQWDLRGLPDYVQENLPHPSVHLTFEDGKPLIYGVLRGRSIHLLRGLGQVFAIKFRPGGFYPFLQTPLSRLTGTVIDATTVFGQGIADLTSTLATTEDDSTLVVLAEEFLRALAPEPDPNLTLVTKMVDLAVADRELLRAEDLAAEFNRSLRYTQRLFNQYVGVGPKWVIQRARLHDAAEQLASGAVTDWSRLAQDLGYFDQAHFIRDFRSTVGRTPAEYARGQQAT